MKWADSQGECEPRPASDGGLYILHIEVRADLRLFLDEVATIMHAG